MNVPTIGGARGIFEVFVPGVFLLLNLGFVASSLPFVDQDTKNLIAATLASPALALVVIVSFGYLLGVLLRLFRTDFPDTLSGWWNRFFARSEDPDENKEWTREVFPYVGWIGKSCDIYLSADVRRFYDSTWGERAKKGTNKQFFNFVKIMVASADSRAATEIYAAEALSRYVAGMFFALVFSLALVGVALGLSGPASPARNTLALVLAAYLFGIWKIVKEFRSIRIKEVEAVFTASYKNRSLFEPPPALSASPTSGGAMAGFSRLLGRSRDLRRARARDVGSK